MSRYENIECPVCKRLFEEGDDIVVCPDCGTPHHRECYNHIGHCVNQGLHKTGYIFEGKEAGADDDIVKAAKALLSNGGEAQNANEGENFPPFMPNIRIIPDVQSAFANDSDTIDGESVSDVAAAVRNNVPRFIRVFKRIESGEKRFSWNWGAFFFGSLYYFYRKIYRQAISLISVVIALFVGSNYAILKFAPKYAKAMNDFMELANQSGSGMNQSEFVKAATQMRNISDAKVATTITMAFFAILLAIRIFEALFADRVYKKNVSLLIKRVNSQLDSGDIISSPMADISEMNLSEEQMKRYYLASKGGVNFFAPMIAFLAAEMLLRIL